jgi:acyl carrier protein
VGECAVVAREFEHGGKRLVAYVTMRGRELNGGGETAGAGGLFNDGELRRYARERLPEYMCPAAYVLLAQLPLNANGKIDRAALPDPPPSIATEAGYVAPRTPAEETLARIWSVLLGAERVGISDNFFDLGGHSLLATQLASRARTAFAVDLPLRAIFENPTLEDLAAFIVTLIEARGERPDAATTDAIRVAPMANDEEVEALLAEIEQLSEEETRMALAPSAADAPDTGGASR